MAGATVRMGTGAGGTGGPGIVGGDFIMFSPDGSHLVSTSKDCIVQVWDVGNGHSIVQRMLNIAQYPHNVSFSHDGTMLSFQSQYLQITLYLHFPSLETITTPPTPVHAHLPQNHPSVHLDQNSLCIKCKNVTSHLLATRLIRTNYTSGSAWESRLCWWEGGTNCFY